MIDGADPDCLVYYCPVCGPCLQQIVEAYDGPPGTITVHANIPHPYDMTFDEDKTLQ